MAPLALSELASIITRIEDYGIRADLAQWAARHIETVHINSQSPIIKGLPVKGLEAWDLRMLREKVLRALLGKIGVMETRSADGSWLTQRVGLVIIKD